MNNPLNETRFEEHIAECLAQGDLYNQRLSSQFNIEKLCDEEMLERFLRAVRKLRRMVRQDGPGHNYLIQHSAGSGKTKSMAWLAHQLANMTNADRTPIFDSIIMVTDRIVLNRNMADDVVNFQTVAGTVKDIRRGSKNLATALNEGHRIIISTVQKFAFALKDLKREQRKYAQYLDMVTNWRNDQAHTAPTASEQEINAAISVVVAMYLYITGDSITALEIADSTREQPTAIKLPENRKKPAERVDVVGF